MTIRHLIALLSLTALFSTGGGHKFAVEADSQLFSEIKNHQEVAPGYHFDFKDTLAPPQDCEPRLIDAEISGTSEFSPEPHLTLLYPDYRIRAPPA